MSYEVLNPIKFISCKAPAELASYIEEAGYTVVRVEPCESVPAPIADHPDVVMCRLGIADNAPVFCSDITKLGSSYPADVPYNAACTGKFYIHNIEYSAPELLDAAHAAGMTIVNVRQGYAKCSTVIVDEYSIITYDRGIAVPCEAAGLSVLLVSPESVRLDGYNTGFIGGCSGRINRYSDNRKTRRDRLRSSPKDLIDNNCSDASAGTIVFNGDLSMHPDFLRIKAFIEERGLECKWFEGRELTDIGSIV